MQARTELEDLREVRGDGASGSHAPLLLPGERPPPCLLPRPPEPMYLHLSSKHKMFLDEEPLGKRRRSQKPGMACDSHKRAELAALRQEMESSRGEADLERSLLPEAGQSSSQAWVAPPGEQGPGQGSLVSAREDGVPGKHPEELGSQRSSLMADVANKAWPPSSRSSLGAEQGRVLPQEVAKGPFVAVVGITEAVMDGGAPIQLIPFGREERAEHRRGAEDRSQIRAMASGEKGEAGDPGALSQPRPKEQKPERRLESILAERDLLQQKVQELEEEKSHWQTEFERTQHELMTLRARESESLYWSKKHMGYRQAELQVLKSELERTLEEKTELKERLKATEMRMEVLREAQGSYQSLEGEDRSTLKKLKSLRVNVSRLLASILPHLELEEVNFESDQVDEILQTVLETNHILE
ncbi:MORC family CW-type zinc finger protein 4 [Dromiciops gliroides]|uniref:MORC family CW-type zinc finger protein 4 n=1 Tax=Dromiciops gliroides TaxID=33562 RepID=UPI001CC472EC|nr:MORC family CW-type zinc finger protein 4 [Dromiciops gliroides]XP_043830811.1 MORC family CW-type zinc finger protein 4 [Dromiciops gliroides]XP_043830812.1 MORC family CW-type zinc finger protein 4 [Dromiciops gliroides]XP_043830813.1 MORC family CW-type zinc finger protein 4 [Dromiciops gliroides]XP_043830814.1 MORC family CW-type zinc finger protein 4 [Dromiciops gliroides]